MKKLICCTLGVLVAAWLISSQGSEKTAPVPDVATEAASVNEPVEKHHSRTDAVGAFADILHGGSKAADDLAHNALVALSLEERVALGARISNQILREAKTLPDHSAKLARLAEPLLAKRQTCQDLNFTFTAIESQELNAFSHVGGYVYVNTALIELLPNDDSLQFVLGHEIAHVELGHCARQAAYCQRAEEVGGGIAGAAVSLAYRSVSLGYSEENEHACDAWSYQHLRGLGRSHDELLEFFHVLVRHFPKRSSVPTKPPIGSVASRLRYHLEDHFQSHPAAVERLRRLETLNAQINRQAS